MTVSTTTIIVIAANSLTAVLASALLMLVLWQAPRQRFNQLFALVMLTLAGYSMINGFGRFVGHLNIDPEPVFYTATMFMGLFVVALFFFSAEFSGAHTPTVKIMRTLGLILLLAENIALWTGHVTTNVRPVDSMDGGYQWDFTTIGVVSSLTLMAYLVATAVVLYRMPDERGRSLWPAPVLVICNGLSATLIWPIIQIPLAALFLAAAGGVLGWQVLRYELFNPRAEAHEMLAKKNAELQEANRLKTQFLTNMSHELRTPLNSIIGYSQLVLNGTYGAMNDTQRDRLEKVIRNGHNLLSLINDVLDLNRIEAGHVVLDQHRLPTPDLLDSVLATIEPLAVQKGLVITRDYAAAPPVYADEVRARQIVTNILANAVKFTHEGGITIRAYETGGMLQFEFIDTGIGIRADQTDLVFDEFRQLDDSTTRRYEGTGLGMAITRRLVELHGGRIWLESTPGQGTTFFVTLPSADRVKPTQPVAAAARPAKTVLIVDDSAEAVEMLTDVLCTAGYRVVSARSGAEGLAKAKQTQPDLITLDVMMPGMDGWQVLRALKAEEGTRHIPVMIVSIIDNRPLAISLGANDALTKPFDRNLLLSALDQALEPQNGDHPILVVDDRADDCNMVVEALTERGYAAICANGGPQALEWLGQNVPSLVLLDLVMPDVSGFDVLAYIRADRRLVHVPVIVVTSKELTQDEQDLLRECYAGLVRKGFAGTDVLLRAVEGTLAGEAVPVAEAARV